LGLLLHVTSRNRTGAFQMHGPDRNHSDREFFFRSSVGDKSLPTTFYFILFIVLAILPLTTDILLFPLLANRMNQHVVQHKVIHLLLLSIEVVQPSMFG
jgi:hypothetical protein